MSASAIPMDPAEAALDEILELRAIPRHRDGGPRRCRTRGPCRACEPCSGERRTLVAVAFHAFGFLDEDYVDVGREVFERVPLFVHIKGTSQFLGAGKIRGRDSHLGHLLWAVADKFAADHLDVGIAILDLLDFVSGAFGMEGIVPSVEADESSAGLTQSSNFCLPSGEMGGVFWADFGLQRSPDV